MGVALRQQARRSLAMTPRESGSPHRAQYVSASAIPQRSRIRIGTGWFGCMVSEPRSERSGPS
jgi:hypothetical protein